ncbi:phytoene desaturase family protein [Curvivirga aplysinae]|uniref:phytoene desaturase family protein n=1 Tax=Curvivirga aplysinae TaxID=2529852 RepID=UPI0012BC5A75|nr:NAD(P)/FAD-dependent oxidoreductase [Curvivirga aplysinae]MTI10859.1 NAD(P)/FAD-dependent oxidoreductase [Curvivirga aplysinae]
MTKKYDSIVIGGGHNGLVCAAYLAKAGQKVIVLEANEKVGGMAITSELGGVKVPTVAHIARAVHPKVIKDLGLNIEIAKANIPMIALNTDGQHLKFKGDQVSGMNGAIVSAEDIKGYKSVHRNLQRFAKFLSPMMEAKAPKLKNRDREDTWNLIKLGVKLRLLGKQDMQEFLRIALLNIGDLLEDNIDNKQLIGAAAMDACWGTHLAPRSPGSVLTAMYRETGDMKGTRGAAHIVKGGMGNITDKLLKICTDLGVNVQTNAKVSKIVVEDDCVKGVELDGGEIITAENISSNADPRRTMLDMVGAEHLDINFTRRINNIRDKGDTAKVNLVLDRLPSFKGLSEEDLKARLLVCPDILYAEHAFNHCKYGEMAAKPALEITIPSVSDSSLVNDGKHVMSIVAQYAPYKLKAGWSEDTRNQLFENVIKVLEQYAPDIRECIDVSETLSPADIAKRFNNSGGHWHHVEMQVDQMLMNRPIHGAAQYNTPIEGLYLCGAGAHPGGNVTGVPGMNAAKRILSQKK